jgi:hypothetical protein
MRRMVMVAVVALLAGALVVPATGTAKRKHHKTHTFSFKGTVKASDLVLNDAKGDGPSAGDVYTFTLTFFDKSGKEAAKGHGFCVLGAPTFSTCTAVSDDGKGKLVSTWEDDGDASTPEELAVTGGTRRYRNARGDGVTTQPDPNDPTTFTVSLRGTY